MKQAFKTLALEYAQALDLYGPGAQRDFDHLYDLALEFGQFLPDGVEVLDLGSGGGLPGIPLALERPDLTVHLCEVRQRRAAFLNVAVARLRLQNARVFADDVRKFPHSVSWVTAQAVGEVEDLARLLERVVTPEWHLIVRRARTWYAPSVLQNHSVAVERKPLELDTDLVHLTFRRLR